MHLLMFVILLHVAQFIDVTPPHCTRTPVGHSFHGAAPFEMHVAIGLHNSLCFRLEDKTANTTTSRQSLLHTLSLTSIEHHHPVAHKYNFAIPEMNVTCICECESSTERCSSEAFQDVECPDENDKALGCYRTFSPHQSNASCVSSAPFGSNLCCNIKFEPYENKTYAAVRLGHPNTFANFTYVSYDFAGNSWIEKQKNTFHIQIDGRGQDHPLDTDALLKLAISGGGRLSHQLPKGMYFTQFNPEGGVEGIREGPVNEFTETRLDQLGWYRQNITSGRFYVKNGALVAKNLFSAKVTDCKEQRYNTSFAANFYMSADSAFRLPKLVEEEHPQWMKRAAFNDSSMKQVIVSHSHAPDLHIRLQVANSAVVFIHNSSRITTFDGSIIVDSQSRLYLNLSLSGATGKLNGHIHATESEESSRIYSFSIYVHEIATTNRTILVPLPATVNEGPKRVCMRAEEQEVKGSICTVLPYHEEPLEIDVENDSWRALKGHCPGCNPVKASTPLFFLERFNPLRQFAQQISTEYREQFTNAADVVACVAAIVILYLLLTKFIIPLCECCICPILVAKFTRPRVENKRKKGDRRKRICSRECNEIDEELV